MAKKQLSEKIALELLINSNAISRKKRHASPTKVKGTSAINKTQVLYHKNY